MSVLGSTYRHTGTGMLVTVIDVRSHNGHLLRVRKPNGETMDTCSCDLLSLS